MLFKNSFALIFFQFLSSSKFFCLICSFFWLCVYNRITHCLISFTHVSIPAIYLLLTEEKMISQWAFKQMNASINSFFSVSNFSHHHSIGIILSVCIVGSQNFKLKFANQFSTHKYIARICSDQYPCTHSIKWNFPYHASRSRSPSHISICYTNELAHAYNIQCDQVRTTMNEIIVRVVSTTMPPKCGCCSEEDDESSGLENVKQSAQFEFRGKLIKMANYISEFRDAFNNGLILSSHTIWPLYRIANILFEMSTLFVHLTIR